MAAAFLIANGTAPAITYYCEKLGRDWGAAGGGWSRRREQATAFPTRQAAAALLNGRLWREAPDCVIEEVGAAVDDSKVISPHWRVLELAPGASGREIKRAYRRLAMKHHPDRGGSGELMTQLNAAFHALIGATAKG